jgi:hypothetical protein
MKKDMSFKLMLVGILIFTIMVIFTNFYMKILSNGFLYFLFNLYFLIIGIYIIVKDKELTVNNRVLWLLAVLIFNFIAVISFVLSKRLNNRKLNFPNQ